ncbi:MAG: DUF1566 domain-containing protein [Chloroflexi bacterium]|nr:DUF1566 domain-containing protein [Chloroflexota bacterium]
MRDKILFGLFGILVGVLFSTAAVTRAGDPVGPGTPPSATNSYTLQDIYNRLDSGAAGSQSAFTEPSVAPGTGTMVTLNEIMTAAPAVDNTNGALTANVLRGKTFWGLNNGQWGVQTGTAYPASVPRTGQITSYDTGSDGHLQRGVVWPNPRFTINPNGTVTDNLTGLIWLRSANCWGTQLWANALSLANNLASGQCGLTDGSVAGDWRLPNVRELQSLLSYQRFNPALSDTSGTGPWSNGNPFLSVASNSYWTSTTYRGSTGNAFRVDMVSGVVFSTGKTTGYIVWPVRGGQ